MGVRQPPSKQIIGKLDHICAVIMPTLTTRGEQLLLVDSRWTVEACLVPEKQTLSRKLRYTVSRLRSQSGDEHLNPPV